MKILAAADLHGSRRFYCSLQKLAKEQSPDAIILAGDVTGSSHSPLIESDQLIGLLSHLRVPF